MNDGIHRLGHPHKFISSAYMPVTRVSRTDGVLELQVTADGGGFVVSLPLDSVAESKLIRFDADGEATETVIYPEFMSFTGEAFSVPRAPGDTRVPERITFPAESTSGCTHTIDLYNDSPLPAKTAKADDTDDRSVCS